MIDFSKEKNVMKTKTTGFPNFVFRLIITKSGIHFFILFFNAFLILAGLESLGAAPDGLKAYIGLFKDNAVAVVDAEGFKDSVPHTITSADGTGTREK
jgi:hypothetical protein